MICAEAQEKIQPWADGQLVAQETDALNDHVAGCENCAGQAELLRKNLTFVRDRLGRLAGRLPSDLTFLDELQTRVAGAGVARPEEPPAGDRPGRSRIPVFVPIGGIVLALLGIAWFLFFREGEAPRGAGDRASVTNPDRDRTPTTKEAPVRAAPEKPPAAPPKESRNPRPVAVPIAVRGSVATLLPRLLRSPSQSTMNRMWAALARKPSDVRRVLLTLDLAEKESDRALLALSLAGAVGDLEARARLLDLLGADGSSLVRRAAAGALARFDDRGEPKPQGLVVVSIVKGISVGTGPMADADLRSRLLSAAESERDAEVVASLIRLLGPSQAEDPAIAARVTELLNSKDQKIRAAAVGAMAGTKDAERLVALIRDEELPLETRAELVGYLPGTDAPDLPGMLIDLLREAEDDRIRLEILGALSARADKSIVPELVRILRGDDATEIRAAALGVIAATGGAEALPLLDEVAQNDPDQGIREAARGAAEAIRQARRNR